MTSSPSTHWRPIQLNSWLTDCWEIQHMNQTGEVSWSLRVGWLLTAVSSSSFSPLIMKPFPLPTATTLLHSHCSINTNLMPHLHGETVAETWRMRVSCRVKREREGFPLWYQINQREDWVTLKCPLLHTAVCGYILNTATQAFQYDGHNLKTSVWKQFLPQVSSTPVIMKYLSLFSAARTQS